jgi:glycosyltransferase involved in cell wall biosynthesis
MKVAFFSCSDFVEGNAATSRLRAYAKGLKELDVDASFFTLAPTKFNETGMNAQLKGIKDGTYYQYLCGSNVRSGNPVIRNLKKISNLFRCFCFLLCKGKGFDLMYVYQPGLPEFLPVYLYQALSGKPLIAEKTEYEPAFIPKNIKERCSIFLHRINLLLLPFFTRHLVVISERMKAVFVSGYGQDRVTIIPAIVDFSRFKDPPDTRTNRIGYLGSFAPKDNVIGIIEAFAKASETNKDLKLRLIGYNPYMKFYETLLAQSGVNKEAVEKTGAVTYDDIPELLAECDLLIINKTAEDYSEFGLPTKLAEYMATGRPMISANVGDIPKFIKDGETGFLVEAGNVESLCTIISERYKDYERFDAVGKKGRQVCETFFGHKRQVLILKSLFEKFSR